MASMLVFVIAFAVGCLSGVVVALWSPHRRGGRSRMKAPGISGAKGHAPALIQHPREP